MSNTTPTTREAMIKEVIGVEGGYSDHEADSGGKTNYGITESLARWYGYRGDMQKLPEDVAMYIYTQEFWEKINGDAMLKIDGRITMEVFDTAVNMGVQQAGEFLQVCLNGLNNGEGLYYDIEADGIIGSGTLAALADYLLVRDADVLLKLLNCLQGTFYLHLIDEREKDEAFLYGWIKNRVHI